jgi:hypothetical protein
MNFLSVMKILLFTRVVGDDKYQLRRTAFVLPNACQGAKRKKVFILILSPCVKNFETQQQKKVIS